MAKSNRNEIAGAGPKLFVLLALGGLLLLGGCRKADDQNIAKNKDAEEQKTTVTPPAERKDGPKDLPADTIKTWNDAGGEFSWVRLDEFGHAEFNFDPKNKALPGDLPAFIFFDLKGDGASSKLIAPNVPFGATFQAVPLNDADLKVFGRFKNLQVLDIFRSNVTNAGLTALSDLPNLKTLRLQGTKITDAGLKNVTSHENLRSLVLIGNFTNVGLEELTKLKNLQSLIFMPQNDLKTADWKELAKLTNLRSLGVSGKGMDSGLKELEGLKQLQDLDLGATDVSVAGLKVVRGFSELKSLSLLSCRNVVDPALKELANLKHLKVLLLGETAITDVGLKEIAGLDQLETLHISGTKVTDVGLQNLVQLKNLKLLNIGQATDATLAKLQNALPQCRIVHAPR